MGHINRAKQIADQVNSGRYGYDDPAEALQRAIDDYCYDATDEYKADVYSLIVETWTDQELSEFNVARSMQLAE